MKILIMILLLALPAAAQQRQPPRVWNWSDAALAGSLATDELSTRQALKRCPACHEAGLAPAPRISLKLGLFTTLKLIEWRAPEHRKKIRLFKAAVAGLFIGVTIHNMRVGRQF